MNDNLAQIFGQDFDVASIPPSVDYIPPCKPPCLIESAEVKQTKAGTGHYIALVLIVLDGPYKNRKLFVNINIDNPSEKCVEIGRATLASLWKALGLVAVKSTDQVLNQVVVPHVRVKDGQNVVNTFSASVAQPAPTAPPIAPSFNSALSIDASGSVGIGAAPQATAPPVSQTQQMTAPMRPWEKQ